jgi:uncharacterized protein YjbI with pentapeptide repeats
MLDWIDELKLLYRDISLLGRDYFIIKFTGIKESFDWLRLGRIIMVLIFTVAVIIIVSVLLPLAYQTAWTGFGEQLLTTGEIQPARTLWDWMELILIPLVLAVTIFLLNRSSRISEQRIETEHQREEALRVYLDQVAELLLRMDTDNSNNAAIAGVIRAHTLAVLKRLDGIRKSIILKFLYEAGLISGDNPVLSLERADLTGVIIEASSFLHEINLRGANLDKAKLQWSRIYGGSLSSTSLRRTDLRSSVLSKSVLEYVLLDDSNLYMANLSETRLGKAQFRNAYLAMANLENAIIPRACFNGATLRKANLRGAILEGCDFIKANLTNADLRNSTLKKANLSHAHLNGADLSGADLTNAIVSKKQLRKAKSLQGAKLDGTIDRLGSPQMDL